MRLGHLEVVVTRGKDSPREELDVKIANGSASSFVASGRNAHSSETFGIQITDKSPPGEAEPHRCEIRVDGALIKTVDAFGDAADRPDRRTLFYRKWTQEGFQVLKFRHFMSSLTEVKSRQTDSKELQMKMGTIEVCLYAAEAIRRDTPHERRDTAIHAEPKLFEQRKVGPLSHSAAFDTLVRATRPAATGCGALSKHWRLCNIETQPSP